MQPQTCHLIDCVLATPMHAALPERLSYTHPSQLARGQWVRVPLGKRELLALVWDCKPVEAHTLQEGLSLKPIHEVLALAPMPQSWCELLRFCALYYQRHLGELAMSASPPQLRTLSALQLGRKLKKPRLPKPSQTTQQQALTLSPEQTTALQALSIAACAQTKARKPHLLWGATGSGKTEVYLQLIEAMLMKDASAQALVLVPEINLTPQLEARFKARLEARLGTGSVRLMHSALPPAQRLSNWLSCQGDPSAHGACRVVLGTRLAVFAPLQHLKLLVVDEEHDSSYKAQDGARYSARDLAVARGQIDGALVVLGSATPSIQTWHNCDSGRYQRLLMPSRIGEASVPKVQLQDMRLQPKGTVLAPALLDLVKLCAARGEQSLVFINRRGYAPVLHCGACGWKSDCQHCSAHMVFHKRERLLRCHHCSTTRYVPKACPACGNLDIGTQGRGTEQIEELLIQELQGQQLQGQGLQAQESQALRVLRIDADSTRLKGSLEQQLAAVHGGDVDVLVGTQMVTKGHDFRRIGLVIALNPDAALFAQDYRAGETLFALLMQAAGRAGRSGTSTTQAQFWIQTHEPGHPLYRHLVHHDYAGFAARELKERQAAAMPPFVSHALLRVEAQSQDAAQGFLNAVAQAVQTSLPEFLSLSTDKRVTLYPAIPAPISRVAGIERAQMLLECPSRAVLQPFLAALRPLVQGVDARGLLRWALDVDPTQL